MNVGEAILQGPARNVRVMPRPVHGRNRGGERTDPAIPRLCRRNLHGLRHKQRQGGAVLTPYHVSHLMSECTLDKDEVLGRFENDPDHVLTLYEPTCGAGGLIVASIDVAQRVRRKLRVERICGLRRHRLKVRTHDLTLSLLGVPAVVRLGDALAMDYREAWFTRLPDCRPHFKRRRTRQISTKCHRSEGSRIARTNARQNATKTGKCRYFRPFFENFLQKSPFFGLFLSFLNVSKK